MKYPGIEMPKKLKDEIQLTDTHKTWVHNRIKSTMECYWTYTVLRRKRFWKRIYTFGFIRDDWYVEHNLNRSTMCQCVVPSFFNAIYPDHNERLLRLFHDILYDMGYR